VDGFFRKVFEFQTDKYIVVRQLHARERRVRTLIVSKETHLVRYNNMSPSYPINYPVPVFQTTLPISISPKATDEDIEKLLVLA
jgi:hypothetical protein